MRFGVFSVSNGEHNEHFQHGPGSLKLTPGDSYTPLDREILTKHSSRHKVGLTLVFFACAGLRAALCRKTPTKARRMDCFGDQYL